MLKGSNVKPFFKSRLQVLPVPVIVKKKKNKTKKETYLFEGDDKIATLKIYSFWDQYCKEVRESGGWTTPQ